MAINFKKRDCQILCAREACNQQGLPTDSTEYDLRLLEVNRTNISSLLDACVEDAIGFYYNALISFLEGCEQLNGKQYSWAIVKLYYTVYYCARAQMAFRHFIVVRKNNDLYDFRIIEGEKPHHCKGRNDHQTVISLYQKEFERDYVFSNTINGDLYTSYMMELRDTTHYKQQAMKEPYQLDVFYELDRRLKTSVAVAQVLQEWLGDSDLYCFQENSAYLVTTYEMLRKTAGMYKAQTNRMTTTQSNYIKKLLTNSKMVRFETDLLM